MNNKSRIQVLAPGRTCLFGDHQDYLGLPVIACAIDKYISLKAEENETSRFRLDLPDINKKREIDIDQTFEVLEHRDYFASALKVLRRYGCIPDKGYDIEIKGDLPINAGVSSSSAVVMAWIAFLLEAFGADREITPSLTARIAYEAEVLEHGEPGGLMDQYAIGLGHVLFINTGKEASFEIIGDSMGGLIIGESGVKKETIGTLGNLKSLALKAIDHIKQKKTGFEIINSDFKQYEELSQYVPDDLKPYLFAALKNYSITKEALEVFETDKPDMKNIGRLMNEHHAILKDILKVTVPRIDKMVENALKAGAYGVKIVGSGGGGSIVALAAEDKQEKVIRAIMDAGARAAYKVNVDPGVRILK
ncbi:galactokinase [Leptobacterium flavescens]|uniref:Galactokinase n=1 Tax=Leptobacterium flavescens TaxID=472055 RepID=A0A6P0UX11_9FLAO|nr:galactokinase family protein [Leptobacterium flavescens]NER14976.1 galactokinase [Leptobacterium flavescens]